MKNIIYLLLVVIFFSCGSQMVESKKQEVRLVKFNKHNCDDETDAFEAKNRIANKQYSNDTLIIKVATTANCCTYFDSSASYKKGVLDLSFEESGEYCNCICYYEFDYYILGIKDKIYTVNLNNEKIEYSKEKY